MARLGNHPSQPEAPMCSFNDGTVHRSRGGPRPIDPTQAQFVSGTRIYFEKSARRTGAAAIWFAPSAEQEVAKDLYDESLKVDCIKRFHPQDIYRGPKKKIRPRRVNDSQGRDVRGHETRYAANAMALKREQAEIIDRIQIDGFIRRGGETEPGKRDDKGSPRSFIFEIGDRSAAEYAFVLHRLNQLISRRPAAGNTKEHVCVMDKRVGLYMRYVELNKKVFGVLRIDADLSFESLSRLNDILEQMVRDGEIPFKPHMSVSDERPDGKVERPHLLIFLPVADLVNMDRRRKRGVRDLLRAVERAWIRALEPIGADRGGATNNQRIKNPFCPSMQVGIFQQSQFMSLRDMAAFFRARDPQMLHPFDRDDRDAEKALAEAGMPNDEQSNNLFLWIKKSTWKIPFAERQHRSAAFRSWMADRTLMKAELVDIMISAPRPPSCSASERQVMTIVKSVAKFCASRFNEGMCDTIVNRGAMAPLFVVPMTTNAKQVMAGPWSGARHKAAKTDAVAQAIRTFEAREGCRVSRPTPALVAECKASNAASRSTLFNRWNEFRLLADQESKSVDGKKQINNATNCTEPVERSPDQPGSELKTFGAPERCTSSVPAANANVLPSVVRPSNDLQPAVGVSKFKFRRPLKLVTTLAQVIRVDVIPAERKNLLSAGDSINAADDIAESVCNDAPGMMAAQERPMSSNDINASVAASQDLEDAVQSLMRRLSKLKDAPPMTGLSHAGMSDIVWRREPAKRETANVGT
jgi:hypothetical protein